MDEFLEEFLPKYINKKILKIIEKKETILLSNSPEFLVKKIAEKLCINQVFATKYKIDKNNKFIGIEKMMDGKEKANIVKNKEFLVFTDSIWDLPLINKAKEIILVNPDRKLRSLIKQGNFHEKKRNRYIRR